MKEDLFTNVSPERKRGSATMEFLMIFLALGSAFGAYQFFLWLYGRQYRPKILIGILPHYEIVYERKPVTSYGHHCVATEFIFNPDFFAKEYDVGKPEVIKQSPRDEKRVRKVLRDKNGNCRLPVIIQNLGKGFCKDLFYVVTFYEKQAHREKKSCGKIRIQQIIAERPGKCYLYVSDKLSSFDEKQFYLPEELITNIYGDVGLLAEYIYFETFLEPEAFVLNVIEINVDTDIREFVVLFNIFSLQNEKMFVSKYQHCTIVDNP